jgi:hypothetical protein
MEFIKGCHNMSEQANHKYKIIGIIILFVIIGAALVYIVSNRPSPAQTEEGIQEVIATITANPVVTASTSTINPLPQDSGKELITEHPATPEIKPVPSDPWESFLSRIATIDDVKKNLSLSYGRLNGAIKYKNAEKWKDDDWKEQLTANYLQPSMYEKFIEVIDDKNLKSDLRNIAKLIASVRETRDLTTLKNAYEIVQDIVIYVMPTGAEDLKKTTMFGASFALDEHAEAIRIDKWIKANIK